MLIFVSLMANRWSTSKGAIALPDGFVDAVNNHRYSTRCLHSELKIRVWFCGRFEPPAKEYLSQVDTVMARMMLLLVNSVAAKLSVNMPTKSSNDPI
jgi:hypothetical protein